MKTYPSAVAETYQESPDKPKEIRTLLAGKPEKQKLASEWS
jgi:hypothetical protein